MCTYVYINININIDTRVQDFANELRGERENLLEMDDVIIIINPLLWLVSFLLEVYKFIWNG